ncbi:uncharacterized protein [Anabrus simplex]|uniref:uncharacterized protein n=1 Tax=Anabrus simplex TaxID=316456 RepID=UPI0035A2CEAB
MEKWLENYKLAKKIEDLENRCVEENNLIEAPEVYFKPSTPEQECYFDCFHKGMGLINVNGELNELRFKEMMRMWYFGEKKAAEDAETLMKCASRVKDVEGCQKGVVINTCLFIDDN